MTRAKSYVKGRGAKVCCALLDVLRVAGVQGMSVGHLRKGVLVVLLDDVKRDGPKVPPEFRGFTTEVRQDMEPAPPRMHRKVGAGCAHSRWELKQFMGKGIVANLDCKEPEFIPDSA